VRDPHRAWVRDLRSTLDPRSDPLRASPFLEARAPAAHNPRVARPVRKLWRIRTVVRRRHRTWMVSMTLASLGWGVWWLTAFLMRFAPAHAPSVGSAVTVSCLFASVGFLIALATIRARLSWILITLIPLLANASLLVLPLAVRAIRVIRAEPQAERELPRAPR
jgi:hypothetical protein